MEQIAGVVLNSNETYRGTLRTKNDGLLLCTHRVFNNAIVIWGETGLVS